MSCFHGNHPDACDICDEVDAASKRGYEAGFKACLRENFTATPQRTWVGLTDEEISAIAWNFKVDSQVIRLVELEVMERNL